MALDSPKAKAGGLAFEVILKPASAENPPPIVSNSPPKERSISQEFIDKKLKDAEERRQSLEASRLQQLVKDKERAQEANQRIQDLNESFSKETEKKLQEKMDAMQEKKNAQIKTLLERLSLHAQRVEEVRRMSEQYSTDLKERIERKMENMGEKREAQLQSIQERIRDHQKHVGEVIDASSKFSRDTETKLIQKMEVSLKNREDQLRQLMERLKDHEERARRVRDNKLNKSLSGEAICDDSFNDSALAADNSLTNGNSPGHDVEDDGAEKADC